MGVIERPPVPPAQREPEPPRRTRTRRGGQGERSPPPPLFEPHRPHARSSAAGLLPGTRRYAPYARHPHRIPGDIGSSPAIRWGCRPSRAFANPALRTASRAYRQTSRARRPCIGADRGNLGKSPQRRKAPQKLLRERRTRVGKSRRACRTPAALSIAARGRTCPKGPENGLGTDSCADASARSAIAAPEAPQERRQGCMRTPRRRRRSGWTGP